MERCHEINATLWTSSRENADMKCLPRFTPLQEYVYFEVVYNTLISLMGINMAKFQDFCLRFFPDVAIRAGIF
jgi:hypothetical protein